MKKIIMLMCIYMCLFFQALAFAADYKLNGIGTVTIPDSYHMYTSKSDLNDPWTQENIPVQQRSKLKKLLKNDMIKLMGFNDDMHATLMVLSLLDNDTMKQWDLANFSDEEAIRESDMWEKHKDFGGKTQRTIYKSGDSKFVHFISTKGDKDLYVTVKNGNLLVAAMNANSGKVTETEKFDLKQAVDNLQYEKQEKPSETGKTDNKEMMSALQTLLKRSNGKSVLGNLVGGVILLVILGWRWCKKRKTNNNVDDKDDKDENGEK